MATKLTKFDVRDHLKTVEKQIAYLEAALDQDDPSFIAMAIGDVARARGVSKFSRETGLSREAIYKAFRPGGNPTIETVNKAMQALGLRLKLVPRKAA
ncbi:MAG TPA: addiction module antidote protein [Xanthobacteraceae bacterium]|jgi:probable addiction module antidote protein|nr:addiction module antidote protein [Xanthobacteraceae bacterium]